MTLFSFSGTLTAKAPFDFTQTLRFIEMFAPTYGEQTTTSAHCLKAFPINGQTVVAKVHAEGTIDEPKIFYTFYAAQRLTEEENSAAVDRLRFYLSLDDDLRGFYAIGKKDAQFAPVLEKLYGLHQVKFTTPFENSAWAILSQRTYMNVARKVKDNMSESFGSALEVNDMVYRTFPTAEQLVSLDETALNAVVRNERKTECLISAARAFASVDEMWLRTANYDVVEKWLREIKGIGAWSSTFVMLRGLGRMERIPKDDQRLSSAVQKFFGGGDIGKMAAAYGEFQGYWAYYLRVAG
jgi:DNA-3-methyladenine glycosylase II